MKATKHSTEFLKSIAELMYVMVAIDGTIREEEEQKALELLHSEWNRSEQFNKEQINQIVTSYVNLKEIKPSASDCFRSFKDFKKMHEDIFSKEVSDLLWEMACTVTSEVNRKNKSELILLVKLERILRKGNA